MNIAHLTHKNYFFSIVVEHTDDCFSSWHEPRKYIAPEIGLSDSHPFMNSRFHFLIIEEYVGIAEMHQRARCLC
jgi:hypothetical protein